MKKDQAAVALAKKRWKGATQEEKSATGRNAAEARWNTASSKEREAVGARLAAARKAARDRRAKTGK
jgi:hypothetical protein